MTNDSSVIICQFCPLDDCDNDEHKLNPNEARKRVSLGLDVPWPECQLFVAYVFGHHHTTAAWLAQFDVDDSRVSGWFKRYTDQMIDRYELHRTMT